MIGFSKRREYPSTIATRRDTEDTTIRTGSILVQREEGNPEKKNGLKRNYNRYGTEKRKCPI
jgi:hypothetical protein